ncbi:hypothetical protein [Acetonema longum]|uniref:Uncharacterized protein n=1 Tax=Acetonema longum DSM 6540 TaxID=1009370 RepID=F7NKA6_9FIRM|nr:hypothetical protein [Acetonema longum]EGO63547.1 hypothetical protein ALO_12596 [Acetonema longum DSM 6540]
MRDRAREKEIMAAKTPGKCLYEYQEGDGHVLRMGTALVSRASYETQHIINYDHNLYPEDGEQFDEAKANAQFIARAWTGWPEDMERLERCERMLKRIQFCCGQIYGVCLVCRRERDAGHKPDCELAELLPKEDVHV